MAEERRVEVVVIERLNKTFHAISDAFEVAADRGGYAALEFLADYLNGCDAVSDESIAAFDRMKKAHEARNGDSASLRRAAEIVDRDWDDTRRALAEWQGDARPMADPLTPVFLRWLADQIEGAEW